MSAPYIGLTWDHPRGYQALRVAARINGLVDWHTQPLEGFESAPIAELCANYDLVVLDYPHVGEAVASDCLQPLDSLFKAVDLARIEAAAIGPSYASYNLANRQWALPLDAASQVMAMRADLLSQPAPQTWDDVIAWAQHNTGLALSLAGPHAFLSLLSIAVAIEPDCDLRNRGRWIDPAVAREAWRILSTLARYVPAITFDMNPIALLEHMTESDDVTLCPLVYGYVNYANPQLARPLTFVDAPAIQNGHPPGSIIGGTGIAVSRRCDVNDELRSHLLWLLNEQTQAQFIPAHAGQPSAESSWLNSDLNRAWGDFYANTMATLQQAHIRPRHDGFVSFQTRASAWLREALSQGHDVARTLNTLEKLFHDSHSQRSV